MKDGFLAVADEHSTLGVGAVGPGHPEGEADPAGVLADVEDPLLPGGRIQAVRPASKVGCPGWKAHPEGNGGSVIEEVAGHPFPGGEVVGERQPPVVVPAGFGDSIHHQQGVVARLTLHRHDIQPPRGAGTRRGPVPLVGTVVVIPGSIEGGLRGGSRRITGVDVVPTINGREKVRLGAQAGRETNQQGKPARNAHSGRKPIELQHDARMGEVPKAALFCRRCKVHERARDHWAP